MTGIIDSIIGGDLQDLDKSSGSNLSPADQDAQDWLREVADLNRKGQIKEHFPRLQERLSSEILPQFQTLSKDFKAGIQEAIQTLQNPNRAGQPIPKTVKEKVKQVNQDVGSFEKALLGDGSERPFNPLDVPSDGSTPFSDIRRFLSPEDRQKLVDLSAPVDASADAFTFDLINSVINEAEGIRGQAPRASQTAAFAPPVTPEQLELLRSRASQPGLKTMLAALATKGKINNSVQRGDERGKSAAFKASVRKGKLQQQKILNEISKIKRGEGKYSKLSEDQKKEYIEGFKIKFSQWLQGKELVPSDLVGKRR